MEVTSSSSSSSSSPSLSHYERAYERILLWVECGALCPLDDALLIYAYLAGAADNDALDDYSDDDE